MQQENPETMQFKNGVENLAKKLESERNELVCIIARKDREIVSLKEELARQETWWKDKLRQENEHFAAMKSQWETIGQQKEKEFQSFQADRAADAQRFAMEKVAFENALKEKDLEKEEMQRDVAAMLKECAKKFEEEKLAMKKELQETDEQAIEKMKGMVAHIEEECKKLKTELILKTHAVEKLEHQLHEKDTYIHWLTEKHT